MTKIERSKEWWMARANAEPDVAMDAGGTDQQAASSGVGVEAIRNTLEAMAWERDDREARRVAIWDGMKPHANFIACESAEKKASDLAARYVMDVPSLLAALEHAQQEIAERDEEIERLKRVDRNQKRLLADLDRLTTERDRALAGQAQQEQPRYFTADPPPGANGIRSALCWGNGHAVCINPDCECGCGHPAQPHESGQAQRGQG